MPQILSALLEIWWPLLL